MFDHLRKRIAEIKSAPALVAAASAPRIQAKFRADATTRRGNVPSFGKLGDVPITATARPEAVTITGPDWCVEKAVERGQVDEWVEIVREESRRILGGG